MRWNVQVLKNYAHTPLKTLHTQTRSKEGGDGLEAVVVLYIKVVEWSGVEKGVRQSAGEDKGHIEILPSYHNSSGGLWTYTTLHYTHPAHPLSPLL